MRPSPATEADALEFRRALVSGSGKAWLLAKRTRGVGLEREIDRACMHAQTYDPQVNGSRGKWMYEIAQFGGRVDALRPRMIRAVSRAPDPELWSDVHRFQWLARDAQTGREDSREAVVRAFLHFTDQLVGHVDDEFLRAAGIRSFAAGFDAVARESSEWSLRSYVLAGIKTFGRSRVRKAIGPDALALWAAPPKPTPTRRRWRGPAEWTREEIDGRIGGKDNYGAPAFQRWALAAKPAEIARQDERLVVELNRDAQVRLLAIFAARPMRRSLERTRKFARSRDSILAEAAVEALARAGDTDLLEHARAKLARPLSRLNARWLPLFAHVGSPKDAELVARRLPATARDDLLHLLGWELPGWAERSSFPQLTPALLWIWDRSPCGHCREEALRALAKRKGVPARVWREAEHDAKATIRDFARRSRARRRS